MPLLRNASFKITFVVYLKTEHLLNKDLKPPVYCLCSLLPFLTKRLMEARINTHVILRDILRKSSCCRGTLFRWRNRNNAST